MGDTTAVMARLFRERWLALPAERRLVLAASMFDTARALVEASFPPGLSESDHRLRLCERFYGPELTARCEAAIRAQTREQGSAA